MTSVAEAARNVQMFAGQFHDQPDAILNWEVVDPLMLSDLRVLLTALGCAPRGCEAIEATQFCSPVSEIAQILWVKRDERNLSDLAHRISVVATRGFLERVDAAWEDVRAHLNREHAEGIISYREMKAGLNAAAVIRNAALAAGSGTAKTPQAVECEASQSGGAAATPKGHQHDQ